MMNDYEGGVIFGHIPSACPWLKPGFKNSVCSPKSFFLFNVGPLKEDIFSGHLLSLIFQSTLHITITSLCLGVDTVRFSCLLLCAQNLI